jgi:hypothetical protein
MAVKMAALHITENNVPRLVSLFHWPLGFFKVEFQNRKLQSPNEAYLKKRKRRNSDRRNEERESGEGWVDAGRGTGRFRGAVRTSKASLQMNGNSLKPRRRDQASSPADGQFWNSRLPKQVEHKVDDRHPPLLLHKPIVRKGGCAGKMVTS